MRRSGSPSGAALADCLVVLSSITLVLTLLDESFWSRAYLVAGAVPVLFLLALSWLLRDRQDGVWIYCLVAVVGYAPLGALAALQRPGPWIVPSLETMNRVLGETFIAPGLFVSTLPPVEASGTFMLVPYAIAFGAALPAAWLALATRRPVAPAVPLVAALAATIPVSVLVPDYYIARGVALTVVLVSWAAVRARRSEALVGHHRSGPLATLVTVVVVAAVAGLVNVLTPDNDQTDRVRLDPAGDDRIVVNAAESIVPSLTGGRELFRVRGVPDGARLRFGALDQYDGEAWVPAAESPGAGPAGTFRRIGREIDPLTRGPRIEVRVQIRAGYASDWLPTLGELTRLDLDYTDGRTQLDEVRYNQATASALVVGGVDPRDDYTFTAILPPELSTRDATMEATEAQRQPKGAFLDQYLVPFDRAELAPLQRVQLLARYLRLNGEVRLTGASSQKPVDLGLRLLGARRLVATPFQYSAVMALGASRLGVPARVAVGAAPGRGGVVGPGDVLSWVELQFADGSWRTLDPERYTGVHPYSPDDQAGAVVGAGGWVEDQLDIDEDEIKIPKGADIELSPDAVIEEQSDPWRVVGLGVGALMTLALLALLLVPVAKLLRRARRRRTTSWSRIYVNGWQEVLDAARDRGTPVPERWSRLAQAGALGTGADLARRADAAVFAAGPGPDDRRDAHWAQCQVLRTDLLRGVGVRRRVWAYLNPASLLAGWARRRAEVGSAGQVGHEDRRSRRQQAAGR